MNNHATFLSSVIARLDARKNRLLLTAQVGLPAHQFDAYRKILLDELGKNGFEQDLAEVLLQHNGNGTGGNIPAKKGGAL